MRGLSAQGQEKNGDSPRFFRFFQLQPQQQEPPVPLPELSLSGEMELGGKNSSIGKSTPSKTLQGSSAQLPRLASIQSLDGTQ